MTQIRSCGSIMYFILILNDGKERAKGPWDMAERGCCQMEQGFIAQHLANHMALILTGKR